MAQSPPPMPNLPPEGPQRVIFVLMPQFTLIALAGAMDCLRIANRVADRTLYDWRLVSVDGRDTLCSAGALFRVESGLPDPRPGDMIVIAGGLDIRDHASAGVLDWLGAEAAKGGIVAGICTGAYILARAGLLGGRQATIHWENHESTAGEFPDILLTRAVFTRDANCVTCAGGTAVIDMMLGLIAATHGQALAMGVADQMIYASIRTDQDTQRLSIPTRIGVRHTRLAQVIEAMERHIQTPVSPAEMAREAGLSTRQLERLFRRYLGRTPKRYYLELRLQRARNLLLQTAMTVTEVARASGFATPAHFSRCYRAQYGATPYRERGAPEPKATVAD